MTTCNNNVCLSQDIESPNCIASRLFIRGYHSHETSLSALAAIADIDLATCHDLVRTLLISECGLSSDVFLADTRSFIGHRSSNHAAIVGDAALIQIPRQFEYL